jgi:glucose/arabinose dehydrogenase
MQRKIAPLLYAPEIVAGAALPCLAVAYVASMRDLNVAAVALGVALAWYGSEAFVPFSDGRPSGLPVDVLTGFVSVDDEALGRPVGVAIDRSGALLVPHNVGNRVWRV